MINILDLTLQIKHASKGLKESKELDYHDSALFMQIFKKVSEFEYRYIKNVIEARKEQTPKPEELTT